MDSNNYRIKFSNLDKLLPPCPTTLFYRIVVENFSGKSEDYISNNHKINHSLYSIDNHDIPIVVNDSEVESANMQTSFISGVKYLADSYLNKMGRVRKFFLSKCILCLVYLLNLMKVDKSLYLYNVGFDTSPIFELSSTEIRELTAKVIVDYPQHLLVFSNLDMSKHKKMIEKLLHNGYIKVLISRHYIIDPYAPKNYKVRRVLKKDLQTIKDKGLQIQIFSKEKFDCLKTSKILHNLYNRIYIRKYSIYNPQYTALWFEKMLRSEKFVIHLIIDCGEIVGFFAGYDHADHHTALIVGHNEAPGVLQATWLSQINYASNMNLKLHMGSGIDDYKRRRGAFSVENYHLVYTRHLDFKKRGFIAMLDNITNNSCNVI